MSFNLGGTKKPRIPPAPAIPDPGASEAERLAAKKKRQTAILSRGRRSTILSQSAQGFQGGAPQVRKATLGGGQ